jgi:hypothetical protein
VVASTGDSTIVANRAAAAGALTALASSWSRMGASAETIASSPFALLFICLRHMSGCAVRFQRDANSVELAREPPTRAMHADSRCVPRTAEYLRDFGGIESLPCDEGENLALFGTEARESESGAAELGCRRRRLGLFRALGTNPLGKSVTPTLSALLVREDAPCGPVQPQPPLFTGRQLVEPPPRHEEGLGDDIGRIVAIGPSERVAEHAVVVLLVKSLEAIASRARQVGQR